MVIAPIDCASKAGVFSLGLHHQKRNVDIDISFLLFSSSPGQVRCLRMNKIWIARSW
jgi:hypothetical protein